MFVANFDKIEPYWLLKANFYFTICISLLIEQKKKDIRFYMHLVSSAPLKENCKVMFNYINLKPVCIARQHIAILPEKLDNCF